MNNSVESNISAMAGRWVIDAQHSDATVTATAFGFKSVPAKINVMSGAINVADGKVTVQVLLDPRSVDTGNAKRDDHLRHRDFLDIEKFPESSFVADQSWAGLPGPVQGVLTVKDKQVNVTFDVSNIAVEPGQQVATFTVRGQVDRDQLGLTKTPGFIIKKQLHVTVSVQAHRA